MKPQTAVQKLNAKMTMLAIANAVKSTPATICRIGQGKPCLYDIGVALVALEAKVRADRKTQRSA